ncbi:MAG: PaaI family thioesterase [Prevotella sp.]|nr:PaaI family thioesterase [Prevotella sp.]
MRKIKNPWAHREGYQCFGCCQENPVGVHMEFYEDDADILCFWRPEAHFQGWIDTLHGGIQSVLVDEIASWVVFRKLQTTGVTTRLEMRYLHPIMTTEPQITLRARIKEQHRNLVTIEAVIENSRGEVCSKGEATYFTFTEEKAREMGFTHCDVEDEQLLSM